MERPPNGRWRRMAFGCAALCGFGVLTALGAWQVERLVWKRDLISRVDARVRASPVPAPGPAQFDAREHEYRRVRVQGRFLDDRETLVQATTKLGGGYWVLTPLITDGGFTVLVNRGFVAAARRDDAAWSRIHGETVVTGLVRVSEPGGAFLRDNRPAEDRWYSRDVAAISSARSLGAVAPYFVDAEAAGPPTPGAPVAGLTIVRFNDDHLQYALTWFALAALLAAGAIRLLRQEAHRESPTRHPHPIPQARD